MEDEQSTVKQGFPPSHKNYVISFAFLWHIELPFVPVQHLNI